MLVNLLENAVDPALFNKHISVGEALVDALIGFIVVFLGIALLVLIVWAVGKIMQGTNGKAKTKSEKTAAASTQKSEQMASKEKSLADDGIDEETIAVISTAISAYYTKENSSCGFVVRRIKRM